MKNDVTKQITIKVDYSIRLEDMIAAGQYDWINPHISSNKLMIRPPRSTLCEVKLFCLSNARLNSEASVEAILGHDLQNPWAPAEIQHLLAFGATFSEEQREGPIVGLGSVFGDACDSHVPVLDRNADARNLDLVWWHGNWDTFYRFLAIRKLS